jgi:hypothetical protein
MHIVYAFRAVLVSVGVRSTGCVHCCGRADPAWNAQGKLHRCAQMLTTKRVQLAFQHGRVCLVRTIA